MDNGRNQDQHIFGLTTNQYRLIKEVEELREELKRVITDSDSKKRSRDVDDNDDELSSSNESQNEEKDFIGAISDSNRKKRKHSDAKDEMDDETRKRYIEMVEEWSSDDNNIAFLATECKKLLGIGNEDEEECSDFDYMNENINKLTSGQHALFYITMLKKLQMENDTLINEVKRKNVFMEQEISVIRTKLNCEKQLNLSRDKLIVEKEQQEKLQVEYTSRLKKALKDTEEREATLKETLKEMKNEKDLLSVEFERVEARSKRYESSLKSEEQQKIETINDLQAEHMSEIQSLRRDCDARVARHDNDARAHLKKEISSWSQRVDGSYHVANHTANLRMRTSRDALIECIDNIKRELREQNIELSVSLLSSLDNAPLQFSMSSGLDIVSRAQNMRGFTSSGNGSPSSNDSPQ